MIAASSVRFALPATVSEFWVIGGGLGGLCLSNPGTSALLLGTVCVLTSHYRE
jgi:hypothetical protein